MKLKLLQILFFIFLSSLSTSVEAGCQGTANSCESYSYPNCAGQQGGCADQFGSCSGTFNCTIIDGYGDPQTACNAITGCAWDSADCYNTPHNCNTHGDGGSCSASGCTSNYACTGAPHLCSGHGYGDCPGGCTAVSQGNCTGGACSDATPFGQAVCESYAGMGCSWDGSACQGPACSDFNQGSCVNPCSWNDTSYCTDGTHPVCSNYTGSGQGTCESHACSWTFGSCSGVHNACTTYNGNQANCTSHGCSWDAANCYNNPVGDCTDSELQSSANCSLAAGCTSNYGCGGTPTVCSTLGTQAACVAENGCQWIRRIMIVN